MKRRTQNLLLYWFLFLSIVGADRLSKYYMRLWEGPFVINDYMTFITHYNRGISWGLFHSEGMVLFWCITAVVALFIAGFCLYTFVRYKNHFPVIGEIMVCAGALSNLYDRIVYGGVVDFILLSYQEYSWPVFNVADIFIVIGLLCMLVYGVVYER